MGEVIIYENDGRIKSAVIFVSYLSRSASAVITAAIAAPVVVAAAVAAAAEEQNENNDPPAAVVTIASTHSNYSFCRKDLNQTFFCLFIVHIMPSGKMCYTIRQILQAKCGMIELEHFLERR